MHRENYSQPLPLQLSSKFVSTSVLLRPNDDPYQFAYKKTLSTLDAAGLLALGIAIVLDNHAEEYKQAFAELSQHLLKIHEPFFVKER